MEKAALETENNSLKEQVAKLMASTSAAPQTQTQTQTQPEAGLQAELNSLRQQNEGLTRNMREMAGKLNVRAISLLLLLQAHIRVTGGHSAESPSHGHAKSSRMHFIANVAIA